LTPGETGARLDSNGLHNIVGFLIWKKWETQVADQPKQPDNKRKVKNPETFRERALKATTEGEKPKRSLKAAGDKVTKPVTGPVGRAARKVWNAKALKWLHKPARILGKILFPTYFRESWGELKQVTWPNWTESRRLTFAVLIFAVIFGAIVAGVDYGLDKAFRNLLLK
jgi:preprotein translocase SecE subunit